MTILEALDWGRQQLKSISSQEISAPNPMVDAQVLLAHVLQKPTSFLFSHFSEELTGDVEERYQRAIKRRRQAEPVSQIIGNKSFYGRDFFINQFVLTPRPETEMLVQAALSLANEKTTFFDVGSGSGAIAISIAAESGLPVIATDIDARALEVAKQNCSQHRVESAVSWLHGNLLEPFFKKHIRFPGHENIIIVANLPYLKVAQWLTLTKDVKQFEPKHALVGGVDGLDLYDILFQQIKKYRDYFPDNTQVIIEIDPSQFRNAPALIQEYFPHTILRVENDLAGRARMVVAKI